MYCRTVNTMLKENMYLKDYLKKAGISQRSFAAKCSLSASAITRLLKGERFPAPETLYRIYLETDGQVGAEDFFRQRIGEKNE